VLVFTQTLQWIPDAPNSEAGYFMNSQVLFLPRKVAVVVSSKFQMSLHFKLCMTV